MTPTGRSGDAVVLDGVTKEYPMGGRSVRALDGVSLRIPYGSFWAIMGSSGSGKSTMLNLVGCLDRPTTGRCVVDGLEVGALDDDALSDLRLRRLGFVFQSFNLIPQLTVLENIELPMFYLGFEGARSAKRASELAAKVGLSERLDHRPAELSGGQQQRVSVARALSNEPAILLADEPTGNLDTAMGAQIMDLLKGLNQAGLTIVMVTHEDEVAAHAGGRIIMRDGRVARLEGEAKELNVAAEAGS